MQSRREEFALDPPSPGIGQGALPSAHGASGPSSQTGEMIFMLCFAESRGDVSSD